MEDRLGVAPHQGDLNGFRIARRPESHDDAGTSGRLRPNPQTDLLGKEDSTVSTFTTVTRPSGDKQKPRHTRAAAKLVSLQVERGQANRHQGVSFHASPT